MGRLADFMWRSRFFPRKLSFTREGKIIVLVSVGLGIAAINTGNNLIYLVFSLSLSLIVLSGIMSEANLRRLQCEPIHFGRARARQRVPVAVTLKSARKRFASYSVEVWPWFDSPQVEVGPARFVYVKPGSTVQAACYLTFARRGKYALRAMVISTTFPFSFFKKSVVFPVGEAEQEGATFLVHPALRLPGAGLPRVAGLGEGESTPRSGRGMDFFSVREFRPGDNPRLILYRKSAGRLVPLVKEMEEPGQKLVWVVLINVIEGDNAEGLQQVEKAVEEAAGLTVELLRRGFAVGLASASGIVIEPGIGEVQAQRVLDALATMPVLIGTKEEARKARAFACPPYAEGEIVWLGPS